MEQKYQGVVLTTAHSSKGLEWKAVFNSISGYDSASLHTSGPKHQKKVEEARRLLFVSMTRARTCFTLPDSMWHTVRKMTAHTTSSSGKCLRRKISRTAQSIRTKAEGTGKEKTCRNKEEFP